eukprot:scaffold61461_cov67-Phaeocystis_antarctica.AAC.1
MSTPGWKPETSPVRRWGRTSQWRQSSSHQRLGPPSPARPCSSTGSHCGGQATLRTEGRAFVSSGSCNLWVARRPASSALAPAPDTSPNSASATIGSGSGSTAATGSVVAAAATAVTDSAASASASASTSSNSAAAAGASAVTTAAVSIAPAAASTDSADSAAASAIAAAGGCELVSMAKSIGMNCGGKETRPTRGRVCRCNGACPRACVSRGSLFERGRTAGIVHAALVSESVTSHLASQ